MKSFFTLLLFALLLITVQPASAQSGQAAVNDTTQYPYWIQMMQDPNANFFETQRAFNLYWQDRLIGKGKGWKPFKRWENFMKDRVLPDGTKPGPDQVITAYQEYMQKHDQASTLSGNWTPQGPFSLPSDKGYKGLGRINTVGFHPTDPNTIYVGAPAGGLWKTTVGGNSWTTTTDMLPTLGVSAVAVDPTDPNVVYIGTGDRDAGDAPGVGVMKSTDGGNTWTAANATMGNVIVGKLLISPANHLKIYAATLSGIFVSNDGAVTWTKKIGGDFKDILFKPNSTTILYAVRSGAFYRSLDAGETWTQLANGLASGTRGVIGVTPANPEVIYFMLAQSDNGFSAMFRSMDGGESFTQRSNSPNILGWSCDGSDGGGQAWYDLAIAVDPLNADIVYTGGVDVWKSTNGGTSWFINAHWYGGCGVPAVHADQHYFAFNPLNNRLYIGNDGGVYWTDDGGSSWNEISSGLNISQAYKIGQSATVDDLVANGYQDNGTSLQDGNTWYAIGGGDGMECAIDHSDPMYRYTTVYYGAINRVYGTTNQGTIAANGVNGIDEEGAWVTPFLIDENDPNIMFIGYKNVWRSFNVKAANPGTVKWKKISTINTSNFDVLEQSPANTNILYAGCGGNLYITSEAYAETPNWITLTSNLIGSGSITDLEAHPFLENVVYMCRGNKVYKSEDKGSSWTDISGSLPDIHNSTIVYYKSSQEGLYVGTDAGVYYKENGMSDWIPFSTGLPANAKVTELEIYYDPTGPAGDRIKAGTYGRGMWKSEMYSNTPTVDFTADPLLIPYGCTVNFKDLSSGVPSQWSWSFPGGQPATSTEKNPTGILYETPGIYDVQLTAGNPTGIGSLTKTAYITVSDTVHPIAGFEASPRIYCNINEIVSFTDTSKYCPYSWQWDIQPNTFQFMNGTTATSQNPQVLFLSNGAYTIGLTVSNSNGIASVVKEEYIIVGGYALPYTEDFELGDLNSNGWTIENPDNLMTWDITEVSGNTPGNHAAWMNFYDYMTPPGRRDRMISPPLNFTGTNPVFMTFEHAYASRYAAFSDSLVIYVSEDCGISWERIFQAGEKGQGTFATVPQLLTGFYPTQADDWCGNGWGANCYLIDLTHYANKQGIKLAFETYNRHSNNLFLDNIIISRTTDLPKSSSSDISIIAIPNPTTGKVRLVCNSAVEALNLQVFNTTGRLVMKASLPSGAGLNEQIDLSGLPKGVYMFRINGTNTLKFNKVVLE